MRSKKKTTTLIRLMTLILASLETNKIQKHFSRNLQTFWGSRLFVFSQGCSRYAGCLQRASPMVCSPRCLTSGVTAYSSTRWSPLAAFLFKASLITRSLNICLSLYWFLECPNIYPSLSRPNKHVFWMPPRRGPEFSIGPVFHLTNAKLIMNPNQNANKIEMRTIFSPQVLVHVKAGNTLTIP